MEGYSGKEDRKELPSIQDLMKISDEFWYKDDDEPKHINRFVV